MWQVFLSHPRTIPKRIENAEVKSNVLKRSPFQYQFNLRCALAQGTTIEDEYNLRCPHDCEARSEKREAHCTVPLSSAAAWYRNLVLLLTFAQAD